MKLRLSQNFWLSELTKSSTADRLGIENEPTTEEIVKPHSIDSSCVATCQR